MSKLAFHFCVVCKDEEESGMLEAFGWGVVSDKGILVHTISDTRRAAIVNWLVTEGGTMVYRVTPDAKIEQWWQEFKPSDVEVIELRISPKYAAKVQNG